MWLAWQAWCGEKTVRLRNCQIVSEGEREGQWDGDSFDYSVSPRRPLRPHPQSWLVNNWLKIAKIIQSNPGKADPYADIDFEEINEQTNLANDEIKCLKVKSTSSVSVFNSWNFQVCFDLFDTKKQEFLSGDDLGDIMRAMGFRHPKFFICKMRGEFQANPWDTFQAFWGGAGWTFARGWRGRLWRDWIRCGRFRLRLDFIGQIQIMVN